MAFFGDFNEKDLPKGQDFEPIPAGWYVAKIDKVDVKDTKDGTGKYLNIQYKTLNGRVIFGMINIRNQSQKAEEIGRQQLGDLMRACGLTKISDSDVLQGIDIEIKVGIDPAKDGYEAKNTVKAWKSIEGSKVPVIDVTGAKSPFGSKF